MRKVTAAWTIQGDRYEGKWNSIWAHWIVVMMVVMRMMLLLLLLLLLLRINSSSKAPLSTASKKAWGCSRHRTDSSAHIALKIIAGLGY